MSHAETRRKERLEEVRKFAEDNNIPVQNIQLLNTALTHTSYANEHKGEVIHDNERLEFLGDAVLDLVVGEYLFLRFPTWPEGNLTRAKASAVCKPACAECAAKFHIGDYMRLGRGEEMSGGRTRVSILGDAFEAVMLKHINRGKNRSVLRAIAEINACDNQFAPEWIEPFNQVIHKTLEA